MVANTGVLSMGVSVSTVSSTTTTFTSMPAVDAEGLRQDPSTDPTSVWLAFRREREATSGVGTPSPAQVRLCQTSTSRASLKLSLQLSFLGEEKLV